MLKSLTMCFPLYPHPLSLVVVLYVQGIGTKEWREVSETMSPVIPPAGWAWTNLLVSFSSATWMKQKCPGLMGLISFIWLGDEESSIRLTGFLPVLLLLPLVPNHYSLLFLCSLFFSVFQSIIEHIVLIRASQNYQRVTVAYQVGGQT